jgi:hypothetical protein
LIQLGYVLLLYPVGYVQIYREVMFMKTKHTKGPWLIAPSDGRFFVYALNDEGTNAFHASVSPGHIPHYDDEETQKANARLIAAAPDLLEASQDLLATIIQNHPIYDAYHKVQVLRAAINKAIGET